MAILSRKPQKKSADTPKTQPVAASVAVPVATPQTRTARGLSYAHSIIRRPRVTEKVTRLAEQNVYTFDVTLSATKGEVSAAIFTLYKVHPSKVRLVRVRPKNMFAKRTRGRSPQGLKAYVYLKKGDTIEFV